MAGLPGFASHGSSLIHLGAAWLPIVEAPGCFRHPTSILAMQLLITTIHKIMQGTELMTTDNTWSFKA